jgi:hypothetical protein
MKLEIIILNKVNQTQIDIFSHIQNINIDYYFIIIKDKTVEQVQCVGICLWEVGWMEEMKIK